MENRFFTIKSLGEKYSPYEIEVDYTLPNIVSQSAADSHFFNELVTYAWLRTGSQTKLHAFLTFQMANSPAPKSEFVSHVKKLIDGKEYQFKPYQKAVGYINDWISQQNFPTASKSNDSKISTKDLSFKEVLKDAQKMDNILKHLQTIGIIDSDSTWRGFSEARKSELMAFIHVLIDERVIKPENKSMLGRIFSKKFNCTMQPRMFTTTVKADKLDQIREEIASFLK